jgi:HAMP domain-containing protein
MDSLAVAFLGVIALSSLVQAVFLIGLAIQGRRLQRRIAELGDRVDRDIQPSLAHLTRVTRNAAEVSDLAVVEMRRFDLMLAELSERLDETSRVVQKLVLRPLRPIAEIAAFVKGVRRGLDVYHRLRGEESRRRPARRRDDDDEHLFI